MPREMILSKDTILYSPSEPEGRTFPAGEQWPGDAWTDRKGGEPVASASKTEALKELIQAHDEIERLTTALASRDHDLGLRADERDAALSEVRGLKQAALDAGKAAAESRELHLAAVDERDRARIEAQGANERADAAKEIIERLAGELATASQQVADLKAEVAKMDGNGDGKVGGSKKTSAKAENPAAEPAPAPAP